MSYLQRDRKSIAVYSPEPPPDSILIISSIQGQFIIKEVQNHTRTMLGEHQHYMFHVGVTKVQYPLNPTTVPGNNISIKIQNEPV